MTIKTVMLHLYASTEPWNKPGDTEVSPHDFRATGYHDSVREGRIWLGQTEVEIDFPDIDTRAAQIEQLESQIESVQVESRKAVNVLLDRISTLRAIGHD